MCVVVFCLFLSSSFFFFFSCFVFGFDPGAGVHLAPSEPILNSCT